MMLGSRLLALTVALAMTAGLVFGTMAVLSHLVPSMQAWHAALTPVETAILHGVLSAISGSIGIFVMIAGAHAEARKPKPAEPGRWRPVSRPDPDPFRIRSRHGA